MMLDLTQEIKREDTVTTIKEQLLMAQKKEQMFTVIEMLQYREAHGIIVLVKIQKNVNIHIHCTLVTCSIPKIDMDAC